MSVTIHHGDCVDVLRTLEPGSVQCVMTSPPYWSLRDYGVPPSIWGGDPTCEHQWQSAGKVEGYTSKTKWQHTDETGGAVSRENNPDGWRQIEQGRFCLACGAWLGALGLEPTPDLYIAHLVLVFREVRRVLKADGTLWLNLGDSYAAQRGGTSMPAETLAGGVSGKGGLDAHRGRRSVETLGGRQDEADPDFSTGPDFSAGPVAHRNAAAFGLKHKDLVGIPWMAAFALRSDGWWLRDDIIWHKPNPMPSSVEDRTTKAHEYLFLLSKSARYYYDKEAIAEPCSDAMIAQVEQGYEGDGQKDYETAGVQNPSDVKSRIIGNARKRADRFGGNKHTGETSKHSDGSVYTGRPTRNKRSVWTIPTQPTSEEHFAAFPEDLVEPCILAGSRRGDVVLDPFVGIGRCGIVAVRNHRAFVGIDFNASHAETTRRYLQQIDFSQPWPVKPSTTNCPLFEMAAFEE